ncbi:hypothetical protein ONZ45_g839 [Pleurotus djamor]|nr:hypothetical protein ONZ45_g839 [Pleurotus djamor]
MRFSIKLALVAFLAQVALTNAIPTSDYDDENDNALQARGPRQRPTQQECEVACTLAGAQGAAWTDCVNRCMASNYPSPPPTPGNNRKGGPQRTRNGGGIKIKKSEPKKTGPKKSEPARKSKPRNVEDDESA